MFLFELSGGAKENLVTLQRVPGRDHHRIVSRLLSHSSRAKDTWVSPFAGPDSYRNKIRFEVRNKLKISATR